jgi:hypothetical protein
MRLLLIALLSLISSLAFAAADRPHRIITEGGVQRIAIEPAPRQPAVIATTPQRLPATAPAYHVQRQPAIVRSSRIGLPTRRSHTGNPVTNIAGSAINTATQTTERTLNREINNAIRKSIRRTIQF